MYELMAFVSWIIRTYYLPNPFVGTIIPEDYNLLIGWLLSTITYLVVKIFYSKGSFPLLGAVLFLIFYYVHNELIALAGIFDFSKLSIYIILGLYVAVLAVIKSFLSMRGY